MKQLIILTALLLSLAADAQVPAAVMKNDTPQKQEQKVSETKQTENIQKKKEPLTDDLAHHLNKKLNNDPKSQLIYTGSAILITLLLAGIVGRLLRRKRKDEKKEFSVLLGKVIASPISAAIFIAGIYVSILPYLTVLPENMFLMTEKALAAALCIMIAWLLYRSADLLDYAMQRFVDDTGSPIDTLIVGVLRKIIKVTILVLAILFIGQNVLNMNIGTLLAGAGVVGLAIAFAAQDTIANFFGSIMLVIDKPFGVGDFVKLDTFTGTVERVGLRSSALRTLDGHLITIPNKNAAGVPVENISMRPNIKKIINLGLTYDTSPEKMRKAIEILHSIFDNHEGMVPELPPFINFTEFKDFSLNIQVIVWYHPNDFMKSIEWMNGKNMEILERFNAEGLDFAFPTNTTYLAYDAKRRVGMDISTGNVQ